MSDTKAAPADRIEAQIIPFPGRKAATPAPVAENPPENPREPPAERLRRALAMLVAAQQEQREALARWQDAIGDLQTSLRDLGASLRNTQGTLERISSPSAP